MQKTLVIFSDGGARGNPGPSAYALLVYLNDRLIYKESRYLGFQTNNFAEYSGLLNALIWLDKNKSEVSYEKIIFNMDSELVIKQMTGKYKIKNSTLKNFFLQIKKIEQSLNKKIEYVALPREKNKEADFLVNKTLDEKRENFT